MGTVEERKANDRAVDDAIELCANGNKDAAEYLSGFAFVCRVFDDLIDKDYEVLDENIYRAFFYLMAGFWVNPFFSRNFRMLVPLHIVACNTFMDSNTWAKDPDELRKIYAHVLKDFVNELFGMVAFLTGGYGHMRKVSLIIREAFLEEVDHGTM